MTLIIILIVVPVLVVILLLLNVLLSKNQPDLEKVSVYECGFTHVGSPRSQFNVGFYLVAILFLIFDLEIAVIFPLAVTLSSISIYGLTVGFIFIGLLTVGFVYEIGTGSLNFATENTTLKHQHQTPSPNTLTKHHTIK